MALTNKRTLLCTTILVAALSGAAQAFAQDQAPPSQAPSQLDTIVVTGTSIRGVAPVGSATVEMGRQEILQSGKRDPALLIQSLPQGSGLGFQETTSVGGGQGVNLRGLGTNATLVMFDGHRLVGQGVTDQFPDPNQLPFSAIQRVEVVTDGASAIYGSDAVAGVVNYILRKNYDGFEVTVRNVDSIYSAHAFDGLAGKTWSGGGFMFGALYEHRGTFNSGQRAYLRQDLRPYGGNNNSFVNNTVTPGALGDILANNQIYGLPNTNGAIPTAAQVQALLNHPNTVDSSDYLQYQPDRFRYAAMFRINQEIGSKLKVSFTSLYSRRDSLSDRFDTVSIPIPSSSPYYIPGLTTTKNATYNLQYNLTLNKGTLAVVNRAQDQSVNNYLDVTYELGRGWELTATGAAGVNFSCGNCGTRANATYTAVAGQAAYASQFNPYLVGPQNAFLSEAYGYSNQHSAFQLLDGIAKLDGPVVSLPGGEMRLAVGGEITRQLQGLKLVQTTANVTNTPTIFRDTHQQRIVQSLFTELFVPIVGAGNNRPGVRRLDLNLAVRYDRYSDFGVTTNPKFGLSYNPIEDLALRASAGTSFRAPTLTENNPGVLEQITRANYTNGAGDPAIPITNASTLTSSVLQRIGNTTGLKPETARVWSIGGEYKPSFVPGLDISLTYYSVDYTNRIGNVPNLTSALANAANRQLYAPFILAAPQPKTCVNGDFTTYNPAYLPYVTSPNSFTSTTINDCALTAIVLGGQRNTGKLNQNGIDLSVAKRFETTAGRFTFNLAATKILGQTQSLLPGGALVTAVDRIGFQVSARGNARLTWEKGPFSATVSAQYVGSYLNNQTIAVNGALLPATQVPAWTTFGFTVAYTVPDKAPAWSRGIRASVSIDNFTDRAPPIVLTGTTGFDVANANPFGRITTFELTKKF